MNWSQHRQTFHGIQRHASNQRPSLAFRWAKAAFFLGAKDDICFAHDAKTTRRGTVTVMAIVTLLVMTSIFVSLTRTQMLRASHNDVMHWQAQAESLAQAALLKASQQLTVQPDYAGENWEVTFPQVNLKNGLATITLSPGPRSNVRKVSIVAIVPNDPTQRAQVSLATTITLAFHLPNETSSTTENENASSNEK